MALWSGLMFFVFWHSHTLFSTWVYHHGTMCRVHSWILYDLDLWPQYQNYFLSWIWVWQDVFPLWHTKFWQMGVSPWDKTLCTFLTLVWPWPLTYMWLARLFVVSFTHRFYLVNWLLPIFHYHILSNCQSL